MSSNADEQLNVLVRVAADRASAQQAGEAIRKNVTQTAKEARDALGELGPVAAAGVKVVETRLDVLGIKLQLARDQANQINATYREMGDSGGEALDEVALSAQDAADAVERLRDEQLAANEALQAAPRPAEDAFLPDQPSQPSSPTASSNLRLGQAGSLISQTISATGNSEIARAAGLLGQVGNAAATANPAFLALTAAGAGVAFIAGEITKRYEAQVKAGQTFVEQQSQIVDLIAGGATRDDIQTRITNLETARNATAATLDLLNEYQTRVTAADNAMIEARMHGVLGIEDLNRAEEDRAEALAELAGLTNGLVTDEVSLSAAITATGDRVDAFQSNINGLNIALEQGVFDSNDFNAALATLGNGLGQAGRDAITFIEDLVNSAQEIRAGQIDRSFDFRRQAIDLRDNGDIDQYNALIRNRQIEYQLNEEQIRQLEALGGSSKQVATEIENLRIRQDELMQGNQLLADSVYPVIRAREEERLQLEQDQESMNKRLQAQQTAMEAAAAATDNLIKAQADYTTAQAAVAEATIKLEQVDSDLAESVQKISDERSAKELEAVTERDSALEEQAAKHADKILEINRRADASVEEAVFARDDLARTRAENKRKEDLANEEDANKEQQATIDKAYKSQLDSAKKAAESSIANERDRADKERQIRQQAKSQALADAQNASLNLQTQQKYFNSLAYNQEAMDRARMVQVQQAALDTMVQAEFNAGKDRAAAFKAGFGSSSFPTLTGTQSFSGVPQTTFVGGSSKVEMPISVTGSSRDQILGDLYTKVSTVLDKLGIKA